MIFNDDLLRNSENQSLLQVLVLTNPNSVFMKAMFLMLWFVDGWMFEVNF